ncbi:MAG TPA: hypothetical protein V6C96_04320, partial [Vampirovibrionales bacterium]
VKKDGDLGETKTSWDFKSPTGIATNSNGEIYVADFTSNKIEKINPQTNQRVIMAAGGLIQGPSALTYDKINDVLLVTNYKSGTLTGIDRKGMIEILLESLDKPYALHLSADRKLYISEQGKQSVTIIELPKR